MLSKCTGHFVPMIAGRDYLGILDFHTFRKHLVGKYILKNTLVKVLCFQPQNLIQMEYLGFPLPAADSVDFGQEGRVELKVKHIAGTLARNFE